MSDTTLQFSTRVDLAGAKAGFADLNTEIQGQMQDAADSVAAASTSITESFEAQSTAATRSIDIQEAAYKQLASATLESVTARRQAADAQSAYLKGELPVAEAEKLLAESMVRTKEAAEQLSFAESNLKEVLSFLNPELDKAVVKVKALGAAHEVTGQQAASGAIRVAEGTGALRAVENFISKTLGLGPVLQAIFPVVGAIAFGEVVFDIGEKIYDLERKTVRAAASIKDAFGAIHDKASVTNDDLELQNDRLQDEIDKLSGHPNNGLQTALDESRKLADQLLVSLQADRKELEQLLKENDVSNLASLLSGVASNAQVASTGKEGKQLIQDQKNLTAEVRKAKSEFETAVNGVTDSAVITAAGNRRDAAIRASYQKQIDSYKRESVRLQKEQEDSKTAADMAAGMGGQAGGFGHEIDNSDKINLIEGRTEKLQDDMRRENLMVDAFGREKEVGVLKQAKELHKIDDAAAREKMKAIETEFADLNRQRQLFEGQVLQPAAAEQFWSGYLATFKHGTDQYRKVLDETIKYSQDAHKQLFDEVLKTSPQQAIHIAHGPDERLRALQAGSKAAEEDAKQQAAVQKVAGEVGKEFQKQADDLTHTGDRWAPFNAAVSAGEIAQIQSKNALAAANDAIAVQRGLLTQTEADTRAAARETAEYAAKMKVLSDELKRLEASSVMKKNGFGLMVNTDTQNASEIQKVQNEMAALSGAHAVTKTGDQNKITQDIAKPYLKAFNTIDEGWRKVQADMIAGNKNIQQDFVMLGVHMVQDSAAALEKLLADWVRHQIMKVAAAHVAAAGTAAAAAEGQAAAEAIDHKQKLDDAKAAARGAYKAVVGIPYVGPILAPIAAGVAFAAVEAFEQGGIVGGAPGMPVPIIAHAGERILSAPQTQQFERLVNNGKGGGGGGDSFHLHYQGQVNAYDRNGMRSTLQAHANDILDIVKQGFNRGSVK